jgi:hypothetical protein
VFFLAGWCAHYTATRQRIHRFVWNVGEQKFESKMKVPENAVSIGQMDVHFLIESDD